MPDTHAVTSAEEALRYNRAVTITTIFFDLDDTLYSADSGLWQQIKERIGLYMLERLHIPAGQVPTLRRQYFEQYGTTLRGLQAHHTFEVADFLAYVHDVPLADYIQPNPALRSVLETIPARKFIFTNADANHARRVLGVLQMENCFDGIVDVVAIDPYCKPMPESFGIALKTAGESDPRRCAMIDDMPRTTLAAREQGLYTILYGVAGPQTAADATLTDWSQLPGLLNGRQ
jgi:putative hydrolase of the HAD superfamily